MLPSSFFFLRKLLGVRSAIVFGEERDEKNFWLFSEELKCTCTVEETACSWTQETVGQSTKKTSFQLDRHWPGGSKSLIRGHCEWKPLTKVSMNEVLDLTLYSGSSGAHLCALVWRLHLLWVQVAGEFPVAADSGSYDWLAASNSVNHSAGVPHDQWCLLNWARTDSGWGSHECRSHAHFTLGADKLYFHLFTGI